MAALVILILAVAATMARRAAEREWQEAVEVSWTPPPDDQWYWPDGCRGLHTPGLACTMALVPVNRNDPDEVARFRSWYVSRGSRRGAQ